jgi:hypothetical protein
MYHKAKRYISFFVLIGLISAIPAFANPVKAGKTRKSESFVINLQNSKNLIAESKIVSSNADHLYRLSIKQGETISFKLRSLDRTSLKVQSPSGIVKQTVDTRTHEGILTGDGEFILEISAADSSVYRLEVKKR